MATNRYDFHDLIKHQPVYGACTTYRALENGRCRYCYHDKAAHDEEPKTSHHNFIYAPMPYAFEDVAQLVDISWVDCWEDLQFVDKAVLVKAILTGHLLIDYEQVVSPDTPPDTLTPLQVAAIDRMAMLLPELSRTMQQIVDAATALIPVVYASIQTFSSLGVWFQNRMEELSPMNLAKSLDQELHKIAGVEEDEAVADELLKFKGSDFVEPKGEGE